GEVYRYRVVGKGYTLKDLKTAEDWILERQFKTVQGVIDVTSYGGETKQYHVEVDPFRLRGNNATLAQVTNAIQNANENVGGDRLFMGEQSYDVRGIGLLGSRNAAQRDIENIVVSEQKGTPVRIRDVADVDIGHAPRLGLVGYDGEPDVVQGIVLMRYGGETQPTLEGIHAKVDYIRLNHILPPGMDIQPYYDRGALVKLTTHTVIENLLVGMGLVTAILFIFLGHVRAALITAINIPLALLIAFCGLVGTKTSANLISLGAVDFLPLFTMTGVSGVIFAPMAKTYAFAIGGAIVLALTFTPVLASKVIPAQEEEKESAVMRGLAHVYNPMFAWVVKRANW